MLPFLSQERLIERFGDPERARLLIVASLCLIGALLGAMVLATFRRSMRAAQASTAVGLAPESKIFTHAAIAESMQSTSAEIASIPRAVKEFGGYLREAVEELEGKYVCFRPTFGNPKIINAYITVIRWDEKQSCLIFEEQSRADSGYVQSGRVYIPDGKPFINLVTVERGAVRLIMVSRPADKGFARGLVMTLANSRGVHFTPATAPVVLTRVGDETHHLGFVHPGSPGYDTYRAELAAVMPDYGLFAEAPVAPDDAGTGTRLIAVR
jgi:hypothetical protein